MVRLASTDSSPSRADRPRIVVCVKGLDFFDERRRPLLEWTLLQFALGASRVLLYIYHLSAETRAMLERVAADLPLQLVSRRSSNTSQYETADRPHAAR